MITAIILFAGEGARFGSPLPKQFHLLAGKKVYLHTLDAFARSNLFDEILLVCPPGREADVTQETAAYPNTRVITGGKSRQESSYLGVVACHPAATHVVIHDGVRPFVTQEILRANVEAVRLHEAVDTCIPSTDTLAHTSDGVHIDAIPKRSTLLRGQTPQSFSYPLILEAHQRAAFAASDECSLIVALGHPVFIVPGDERNIKITSPLDLLLAEHLLSESEIRVRVRDVPALSPSFLCKNNRFL